MNIGRLERVELRELWRHEEYDFSAWLAQPYNLELLSNEIGISLGDPQRELGVGKFSADILAEEEGTGRRVLIENQIEGTNHDHLGKIITYAAGLDAKILIWIVKHAREEHEQAVTWLNEHTDESLSIFLIQLEAWKIANSDPAPKFNIVVKPNDWTKIIRSSTDNRSTTEYKLLQQNFWEGLAQADGKNQLGSRKARPRHWHDVSIGSSLAHISLTINKNEGMIGCELYIPRDNDKLLFDALYAQKEEIELALGQKLEWMRLEHRIASRIKVTLAAAIHEEAAWPEYYAWLLSQVTAFRKIFGARIR